MYHDNLCTNAHLFMFLEKPRIFISGVTEDREENTVTKQTSGYAFLKQQVLFYNQIVPTPDSGLDLNPLPFSPLNGC